MIKQIRKVIHHSAINAERFGNVEFKKPVHMMFDLFKWTLANRGHISDFFLIGLDQKGKNLSEFLTYRSLKSKYRDFYPPNYLCLLEDKQVFEKFINNFPQYAPRNIGSISKYHFYLTDSKPLPISDIVKYNIRCIVKNNWGFGGKNIFLLTVESGTIYINGHKSTLQELINRIPDRSVLQEILEQHEDVKKFHPSSINTTRIITVNTGTKVNVISSFIRLGTGGNFVDNISQGNIFVPVDRKTGKLHNMGCSEKNSTFHLSHPETGIVFKDQQIPFFKEALELCTNLHYQLPYFFMLGWDIAYTPKGPVVIESNNLHQVVVEQMIEGGLKKQFDGYIREFMENKKKERKLDYA